MRLHRAAILVVFVCVAILVGTFTAVKMSNDSTRRNAEAKGVTWATDRRASPADCDRAVWQGVARAQVHDSADYIEDWLKGCYSVGQAVTRDGDNP